MGDGGRRIRNTKSSSARESQVSLGDMRSCHKQTLCENGLRSASKYKLVILKLVSTEPRVPSKGRNSMGAEVSVGLRDASVLFIVPSSVQIP